MPTPNPTTVDAAVALGRQLGVDRLDTQLLVAHALGRGRSWVLAHGEAALGPVESASIAASISSRADGVPIAYLIGEKEFHGLTLKVDGRVLVPRPDSETGVDWALELLGDSNSQWPARPAVVDLGTGSGALAAAIAHRAAAASVVAVDSSVDAIAVARANFDRLALPIECVVGNWWSAIDERCFDLAISNPPYIAEADPHLAALGHEPRSALVAGADGLDDIRQIVARAPRHLARGGWLLLEHGHDQAAKVRSLLEAAGFIAVETRIDLAGIDRYTGGKRP